jgi:hypothetical protein
MNKVAQGASGVGLDGVDQDLAGAAVGSPDPLAELARIIRGETSESSPGRPDFDLAAFELMLRDVAGAAPPASGAPLPHVADGPLALTQAPPPAGGASAIDGAGLLAALEAQLAPQAAAGAEVAAQGLRPAFDALDPPPEPISALPAPLDPGFEAMLSEFEALSRRQAPDVHAAVEAPAPPPFAAVGTEPAAMSELDPALSLAAVQPHGAAHGDGAAIERLLMAPVADASAGLGAAAGAAVLGAGAAAVGAGVAGRAAMGAALASPANDAGARKRRGMMFAAGVVGVGLLGVAGLFALPRGGDKATVASANPPVIAARPGPTRERPANPGGAEIPNQDRAILQERPAGAAVERVLPREEQPLDLAAGQHRAEASASAPSATPTVVSGPRPVASVPIVIGPPSTQPSSTQPSSTQPSSGQSSPSASLAAPSVPSVPVAPPSVAPVGGGQPRVILPSMGAPSAAPGAIPSASASAPSAAPSAPNAATATLPPGRIVPSPVPATPSAMRAPEAVTSPPPVRPVDPPVAAAPSQPASAAAAPAEPRRVRAVPIRANDGEAAPPRQQAARRPAAPAPAEPVLSDPNAPLSLRPGNPALNRSASLAPGAPAVGTPATTASVAERGSGFAVQIGAEGSEDAARARWDRMRGQHASVLGGLSPSVRRAEVNGRDVYRVRVGSMSREEAVSLCNRLKASGGQCFVARN